MSTLIGTSGSDTLDGTSGSDKLNGGAGDDTLIYNVSENSVGTTDIYTGGSGIDTVLLELTLAEWNSSAVQSEINRYTAWLDQVKTNTFGEVSNGSSSDFTFTFGSSTLTVQMMEALRVMVRIGNTYVEVNLDNELVDAVDDTATILGSDININVLANDSVPDLVSDLAFDPAFGSALQYGAAALVKPTSDASTWYFTYTLNTNDFDYKALGGGVEGTDRFSYIVTDANGDTDTAIVSVKVKGVNDLAMISDANNNGTDDFLGTVTEAGPNDEGISEAIGKLSISDPDTGESKFQAVSGRGDKGYGTYVTTMSGSWAYTLDNDNAAVNALDQGATLTDTFTIMSFDGFSGAQIVITINGVSDVVPPTANPDELWVTSNTQVTLSTQVLLKNDTGADQEDLAITAVSAPAGVTGLTLNADGTFSFDSGTNGGTVDVPNSYSFTYTVKNMVTNDTALGTVTVKVVAISKTLPNTVDLSDKFYDGAYLAGGSEIDTIKAGSGDTVILGDTPDINLSGGTLIDFFNNYVKGGIPTNGLPETNFPNFLYGGAGNDTLYGMRGNDFLQGGGGNDRLLGGDGNDEFHDASGSNTMVGGAGADRFALSNTNLNTILDFSVSDNDKLLINDFFDPADASFVFSSTETGEAAAAGEFLYNSTTGQLFFGTVQIGLIGTGDGTEHPLLNASSFSFVV